VVLPRSPGPLSYGTRWYDSQQSSVNIEKYRRFNELYSFERNKVL